jgi:hypothetical protein
MASEVFQLGLHHKSRATEIAISDRAARILDEEILPQGAGSVVVIRQGHPSGAVPRLRAFFPEDLPIEIILTDKLSYYSSDPDEVRRFCLQNHILSSAEKAIEVAERCFASNRLSVQVEKDPESEEEWLIIDVDVRGEVKDVLAAYDTFKTEWLFLAGSYGQSLIRVLYNIL